MKKLFIILFLFAITSQIVIASPKPNKKFTLCCKEKKYKKTKFNVPYFARKHKNHKH